VEEAPLSLFRWKRRLLGICSRFTLPSSPDPARVVRSRTTRTGHSACRLSRPNSYCWPMPNASSFSGTIPILADAVPEPSSFCDAKDFGAPPSFLNHPFSHVGIFIPIGLLPPVDGVEHQSLLPQPPFSFLIRLASLFFPRAHFCRATSVHHIPFSPLICG